MLCGFPVLAAPRLMIFREIHVGAVIIQRSPVIIRDPLLEVAMPVDEGVHELTRAAIHSCFGSHSSIRWPSGSVIQEKRP
jgi:hypothetical protein